MLSFISPEEATLAIAQRTRARLLSANLSRKSLAEKSGVSEASVKCFETIGEIAFTFDCMHTFDGTFAPKP